MVRVQAVAPGSLGAALGVVPGTELHAVNGRALEDFLDWEFLTADERFVLSATMPGGDAVEYDVERPEGLPMGVTLEAPRIRRCANHCDFCFVDGNPQGLRQVLYIRDDDYRLSFRYGNFATLTNLKPWDLARIVEYRLSPLYVSVHATDPVVRRWLLRNPEAEAIVPQLSWFAERGIAFHTQVVLVPGVNDGAQLVRTLTDLYGIGAAVLSVSVVPVALTEFSKHSLVRQPAREECRAAIATVDAFARRALAAGRVVRRLRAAGERCGVGTLPTDANRRGAPAARGGGVAGQADRRRDRNGDGRAHAPGRDGARSGDRGPVRDPGTREQAVRAIRDHGWTAPGRDAARGAARPPRPRPRLAPCRSGERRPRFHG